MDKMLKDIPEGSMFQSSNVFLFNSLIMHRVSNLNRKEKKRKRSKKSLLGSVDHSKSYSSRHFSKSRETCESSDDDSVHHSKSHKSKPPPKSNETCEDTDPYPEVSHPSSGQQQFAIMQNQNTIPLFTSLMSESISFHVKSASSNEDPQSSQNSLDPHQVFGISRFFAGLIVDPIVRCAVQDPAFTTQVVKAIQSLASSHMDNISSQDLQKINSHSHHTFHHLFDPDNDLSTHAIQNAAQILESDLLKSRSCSSDVDSKDDSDEEQSGERSTEDGDIEDSYIDFD
jgi:hypothetical protein